MQFQKHIEALNSLILNYLSENNLKGHTVIFGDEIKVVVRNKPVSSYPKTTLRAIPK